MLNLKFSREHKSTKGLSKRPEDAGYDLYIDRMDFLDKTKNGIMLVQCSEIAKLSTGIRTAFSSDYVAIVKERSSTGTKGMSIRCGVVDSGYRGVWHIIINNTGEKDIVLYDDSIITELEAINDYYPIEVTAYPISKAIAQAVFHKIPEVDLEEISRDEILEIASERGEGAFGSSGK